MYAGAARFGFRLVHYAVMGNHVHLIVEAPDRRALWRGMQGLGRAHCARAQSRDAAAAGASSAIAITRTS